MSITVQLDLFNTTVPVAMFDWGHKTNLKVFEYDDNLNFVDESLKGNFVVNVPCYKVDSLAPIFFETNEYGEYPRGEVWSKLAKNRKLQKFTLRIYEDKSNWRSTFYVLANEKTKKFVEKHFLFAKIKNVNVKMPRITKKVLEIKQIDSDKNFVLSEVNFAPDHVISQINS